MNDDGVLWVSVRSSTRPNKTHLVMWDTDCGAVSCTCEAWTYNLVCRHVRQTMNEYGLSGQLWLSQRKAQADKSKGETE